MKFFFKPIFALFLITLISADFSSAETQIGMPIGFYQLLPGKKIIYIFQELSRGLNTAEIGLSAVGADGYFLKSEIKSDAELSLTWQKGEAEIIPIEPGHYQLHLKKGENLKKPYLLDYLGETEAEAAKTLGIEAKLPVTRYLSHRGTAQIPVTHSHSMFPGNTIQAMNISLLNGYAGFELDVQMTKDRKFVVSHDNKLSVSTDCTGYVSDRTLDEVMGCNVRFTGFLPEKKWFHSKATISSTIPSLAQVWNQFLPDSRLKHLTVDVKPGNIEDQVEAFSNLLAEVPLEQQKKLIFLIRDEAIQQKLEHLGYTAPLYALESASGWEPLIHQDFYFSQNR